MVIAPIASGCCFFIQAFMFVAKWDDYALFSKELEEGGGLRDDKSMNGSSRIQKGPRHYKVKLQFAYNPCMIHYFAKLWPKAKMMIVFGMA